jgi:hypothetical protein
VRQELDGEPGPLQQLVPGGEDGAEIELVIQRRPPRSWFEPMAQAGLASKPVVRRTLGRTGGSDETGLAKAALCAHSKSSTLAGPRAVSPCFARRAFRLSLQKSTERTTSASSRGLGITRLYDRTQDEYRHC